MDNLRYSGQIKWRNLEPPSGCGVIYCPTLQENFFFRLSHFSVEVTPAEVEAMDRVTFRVLRIPTKASRYRGKKLRDEAVAIQPLKDK